MNLNPKELNQTILSNICNASKMCQVPPPFICSFILGVCMCVFAQICVCTCMHVCTCISIRVHTFAYVCMYVSMHVMCASIHTCVQACMHVCVSMLLCVCVCARAHAWVNKHAVCVWEREREHTCLCAWCACLCLSPFNVTVMGLMLVITNIVMCETSHGQSSLICPTMLPYWSGCYNCETAVIQHCTFLQLDVTDL